MHAPVLQVDLQHLPPLLQRSSYLCKIWPAASQSRRACFVSGCYRLTIPYAVIGLAAVFSAVFAAPLAAGLMSLRGLGGLAGWQYLFILEGIPSIILGLAVWMWLPSHPLDAWMLDQKERELLHQQVCSV